MSADRHSPQHEPKLRLRPTVRVRPRTERYRIPTELSEEHMEMARSAWRRFARGGVRTAAMPAIGPKRSHRAVALAVIFGIIAFGAATAWFGGSPSQPTSAHEVASSSSAQDASATLPRPRIARNEAAFRRHREDSSGRGAAAASGDEPDGAPLAEPSSGSLPEDLPPDVFEPASATGAIPAANMRAFERLPRSARDGRPIGGIGAHGLYIDDLAIGTAADRGQCSGDVMQASVTARPVIHTCVRVVHPRLEQRIIVEWHHDGSLKRRTFVGIPPQHGYRTAAKLRLHGDRIGRWTVVVRSEDGIELGRGGFEAIR